MADTREEASEESSDSIWRDNFSINTETSSFIFEIADCEKVQASY